MIKPQSIRQDIMTRRLSFSQYYTLQMKVRWESNINVWFWFMYSQKWNCMASLFPKHNYNVLSPYVQVHVLWAIYIFPESVCLFCFSQIGRSIQEIFKIAQRNMNVGIGNEVAQFYSGNTKIGFLVQCTRHIKGTVVHYKLSCIPASRVFALSDSQ